MSSLNGWFVRKACARCWWSFQCPVQQQGWRAMCHACERKVEGE